MRIIVIVKTKENIAYEIEKEHNGFMIKSITYVQNGLTSINPGAGPVYLITMYNPHVEKEKIFKMIPYEEMREVLYIESNADKDNSSETAENMKDAKKP